MKPKAEVRKTKENADKKNVPLPSPKRGPRNAKAALVVYKQEGSSQSGRREGGFQARPLSLPPRIEKDGISLLEPSAREAWKQKLKLCQLASNLYQDNPHTSKS